MGQRPGTDLLIRVDPGGPVGLQQQIYAGVRRAILDGVLLPGTRVPSSRALALDLRVSRTTSLLALEQLLSEGYLTARPGSGTFVALELPDDLPGARGSRPKGSPRHPPLSKRGKALAAARPPSERLAGPPRPFRIGIPAVDLFPVRLWSQLWTRRLRSATPSQLDYGETAGLPALRQAIAEHVRAARGTECDPDQVFVVSGARSALVAAGARIRPVPVDEDGLDVEAGARRGPRPRLVYVTPSHQFPLGVPMSLPRRLALLQWAGAAGAWVIEDDYDSEFRYGARPIPCLHGLDADGRVVYVGSFSKTLFPALRLGFMIVPQDLHRELLAVRRATEVHPPRLDQAVLADFMLGGHYERHLRRMRAAYRERLEALQHAAAQRCGGALRLRPVRTGLHAVADLVDVDARRVQEVAAERGVEVMPLSAYYFGRSRGENALVLGFGGVRADSLQDAMKRLAAAIDAARRQP